MRRLTLNSGLVSLRRLTLAFGFCLIFLQVEATAKPWQIQEDLLGEEDLKLIQGEVADIETSRQIAELLRKINLIAPMQKLDILDKGDHWYIQGIRANVVSKIEVSTLSNELRKEIESKLIYYTARIDSPQLRQSILVDAAKILRERGYPMAQIRLGSEANNNKVVYKLVVDEKEPCLVRRVYSESALKKGMAFPIVAGEVCDLLAFNVKFDDFKESLIREGYRENTFAIADIKYDPVLNVADVSLTGEFGQRIKVDINVVDDVNPLFRLFTTNILEDVEKGDLEPESLVAEIRTRYRNAGYINVAVEGPVITQGEDDWVVYKFKVKRGKKFRISQVEFIGVTVFNHRSLSRELGFIGLIGKKTFDPESVEQAKVQLEKMYQDEGYWDAEVNEPHISYDQTNALVSLKMYVDEGQPYILDKVEISGNTVFDRKEILAFLDADPGEKLVQERIVDFEQKLRDFYVSKGYLYAEIKVKVEPKLEKKHIDVIIKVNIEEGVRVKIGMIEIAGLTQTLSRVVRRELLFKSGDWYNMNAIDRSRRALVALSIFRSVAIEFADQYALNEKQEVIDIIVRVKEGLPGTVQFGPGWSLLEGTRFNIEASYLNIGGRGRQIFAKAGISEERRQKAIFRKTLVGRNFTIGYAEPWVMKLPINGFVSFSHSATAEDFWRFDNVGEVSLRHRFAYWFDNGSISLFYRQKIAREEGTQRQDLYLVSSGDVRISSQGIRLSLDERDNPGWTTKGYFFSAKTAWADFNLKGELKYFNWEFTLNKYFSITDDFVLATGLSVVNFENVDRVQSGLDDVLPSSERVYAGGAETVRGYQENSIGPSANGTNDAFGGSHRQVLKLEARYRFYSPLALTAFMDFGNVFFSSAEEKEFNNRFQRFGGSISNERLQNNVVTGLSDYLKDPTKIYKNNFSSYGLALSLLTPLGAFNVAYGIPLSEPRTAACRADKDLCPNLLNKDKSFLSRGTAHINFGVNF